MVIEDSVVGGVLAASFSVFVCFCFFCLGVAFAAVSVARSAGWKLRLLLFLLRVETVKNGLMLN